MDKQEMATEEAPEQPIHHASQQQKEDEKSSEKRKPNPNPNNDTQQQHKVKYKRYLIDRTNGNSRQDDSKPPCFACFVPKPVVWFADYIEQNFIFERLGSFGCFSPDNLKARRCLIGLGLAFNIIGFLMSIFTCFAATTKFHLLWIAPFTTGVLDASSPEFQVTNNFRFGIRAVAASFDFITATNRSISTESVITFDGLCDYTDQIAVDENKCDECARVSSSITVSLFTSTVMCIPSITTSVLRLYPHYDCNCQKIFASFTAVISCAFALYTVLIYQFRCFRSIGQGINCKNDVTGDVVVSSSGPDQESTCPPGFSHIYRNADPGIGWIMLMCACILKCLDMLLNFAIPTPTICRDREEQRQYEILATTDEMDVDEKPNTNDEEEPDT